MGTPRWRRAGTAVLIAAATAGVRAQGSGPSVYTDEQATRGRAAYTSTCASCHGANLRGLNDAPPLVGREFLNAWGQQRVSDLLGFVSQSMPPSGPGSLAPEVALDILSYMLRANGARAGTQALTATATTRVETVAGQVPQTERGLEP
ncbi:MAG TPA: c-type cytochrome [Vicinamibacterales bacterium]